MQLCGIIGQLGDELLFMCMCGVCVCCLCSVCVCGHWCYMCMCVRACVYIVQVHVCIAPYNVMNLNSATQIVTCAQVTIHQHLKLLSHILVVTLLRVYTIFLTTHTHIHTGIYMR